MSDGAAPVLEVRGLTKTYRVRRSLGHSEEVRGVDGVSFTVQPGRTLGIVGESGSGKSTIGRCVLGLQAATGGEILIEGRRVDGLRPREFRPLRRRVQMVFQHPRRSFDPQRTVRASVEEFLQLRTDWPRERRRQRVEEVLRAVNIGPELWHRRPAALSGGQLQRVAVARALAPEPALIFLDEPTSALDTSVRGEVLALLQTLQATSGVAYVFVSHDLEVVRAVAHDVLVLYLGRIVECGPTDQVLRHPEHPYTQTLIAASGLVAGPPLSP